MIRITVLAIFLIGILRGASAGAPSFVPPEDILRAAGYDLDQATSKPAQRRDYGFGRPVYKYFYRLRTGLIVSLELDAETSQTVNLIGTLGRGPDPTSDTANLTPAWARQVLLSMNVYGISQGTVQIADATISYNDEFAQYYVHFARTDMYGHSFAEDGVRFVFDHATSRVTSLALNLYLPEPAVSTGTMVSQAQATSTALAALNGRKPVFFRYVPGKMEFYATTEPIRVFVTQKNNMWSEDLTAVEDLEQTTGTAVSYWIEFGSRVTDPSYFGPVDRVDVRAYVDVFSGNLIGGDYAKTLRLR